MKLCNLAFECVPMDVTFNFNKVYFIVSDRDCGPIEDLFTSVVKRRCEQSNLESKYIKIFGSQDLIKSIELIEADCKSKSVLPYLHIECHGSSDGILLESQERVKWEALGELLTKINIACRNNLFVSMAACFGGYLTLAGLNNIGLSKENRAPVCGFVGPSKEITYEKLENGYSSFFNELLSSFNFSKAVKLMNQNGSYEAGYVIKTCHYIFKEFIETFIQNYLVDRFSSGLKFEIHIQNVLREKFRKTGRWPTTIEYLQTRMYFKNKYQFLNLINEIATFYFMIDLFPENKVRFDLLKDIHQWDLFVANIDFP